MSVILLQVTLGAGATQISSANTLIRQITFQNNAAAVMRLGDSTVSATKGVSLVSGGAAGSTYNSGPSIIQPTYLSDWYVFGTATQVLDVLYIT